MFSDKAENLPWKLGGRPAVETFLTDPAAGELRIGCPESLATALVSPAVQLFIGQYPRVTINIFSSEYAYAGSATVARSHTRLSHRAISCCAD
jgi:hypothetical protein